MLNQSTRWGWVSERISIFSPPNNRLVGDDFGIQIPGCDRYLSGYSNYISVCNCICTPLSLSLTRWHGLESGNQISPVRLQACTD